MLASANGKIRLSVTLPRRIEGKLIDIVSDFDEGYDVQFTSSASLQTVDGRIPVEIAVYCPARDGSLPVHVEFSPVGTGPLTWATAQGSANQWIALRAG